MARKLIVEVLGDASGLEAALGRAGVASETFGSKLGSLAKTAGLVLGGAAIGGLVVGLKDSIQQTEAAQQSTARLDEAFKNAHLSATAYASQIDAVEASSRNLGFTDNDVRQSLGSLLTATGDTSKALSDLSVAEDLARFKNEDLATASQSLAMAMAGSQRAAHQLGIIVSPVTTNLDALKATFKGTATEAQKLEEAHAKLLDKMATGQAVIDATRAKVSGMADTFAGTAAGSIEIFKAQLDHLEVTLGTAVLPAVNKVVDVFTRGVTWTSNFADAFKKLSDAASGVGKPTENAGDSAAHTGAQMSSATAEAIKWHGVIVNLESALVGIVGAISRSYSAVADWVDAVHRANEQFGNNLKAWGTDIENFATRIGSDLKNLASTVYNDAVDIGKNIVSGVEHGLGNIASSIGSTLGNGLHGAVGIAKGILGIHSPSQLTHDQIGVPLAQGVVGGWNDGIAVFPAFMSDTLSSMLAAADKQLRAGLAAMGKEIGVAGPSLLGDANAYNSAAATAAANQAAIDQYTSAVYDNTFATPGYNVGMSAAQVYALSQPPVNLTTTVQIDGNTVGQAVQTWAAQQVTRGAAGVPS